MKADLAAWQQSLMCGGVVNERRAQQAAKGRLRPVGDHAHRVLEPLAPQQRLLETVRLG